MELGNAHQFVALHKTPSERLTYGLLEKIR